MIERSAGDELSARWAQRVRPSLPKIGGFWIIFCALVAAGVGRHWIQERGAVLKSVPNWIDADNIIAAATVGALVLTYFGLREAREQRRKDFLPVVVFSGFWERVTVTSDPRLGGPSSFVRFGVRVANAGRGVALRLSVEWDFDAELDRSNVEVDLLTAPKALPSSSHHDFLITVRDPFHIYLVEPVLQGQPTGKTSVGEVRAGYRDIYGRGGHAASKVHLRRRGDLMEIECEESRFELPGGTD